MVTICYLCMKDAYRRYTDIKKLHESISESGAIATCLEPGSGIRLVELSK